MHELAGVDQLPQPAAETDVPAACVYQGYVDELSHSHAAGWLWSPSEPFGRVAYEVVSPRSGEVLGRGRAEWFQPGLHTVGLPDNRHGYYVRFPRMLTDNERAEAVVRVSATGQVLEPSSWLVSAYQPLQFVIMDIVDNCNLRCPFCVYDYSTTHTTNLMSEATIDVAAKLAPYVTEGNFWFSCLHEPTLHPRLVEFIQKVPFEHRRKLFYTTNLAKRMPQSYFKALADSGMHHINVSIESLDPAVYERFRKGARHRIFTENWDRLVPAFARGKAPPLLRYIAMAYKSNVRDLPAMVEYLLNERGGGEIEVRHTYDVPHLPAQFRRAEYLSQGEWHWLRDELARFPAGKVILVMPPGVDDPGFDAALLADPPPPVAAQAVPIRAASLAPPAGFLPGRYGMRLFWDGCLEVSRVWGDANAPHPGEWRVATLNLHEVDDVARFLADLPV